MNRTPENFSLAARKSLKLAQDKFWWRNCGAKSRAIVKEQRAACDALAVAAEECLPPA
jgi:hypothetical protein